MKTFRFAIMGAGGIAHQFCDAVRRIEGAEVCAVASKSMERAKTFAEKEGIAAYFDCYEQMLDTVKPDAVYVATTHNFHYENVKMVLSKGIPVLCEKPFVLNSADAKELFALAKEKNVLLMEAMWSRFLPQIQKAKEWIKSGAIGTLRMGHCVVGFKGERNPENRVFSPKLAGGAIYDIGVYAIELMTYLVDQPLCDKQVMILPAWTGVDASNVIALKFETCTAALQTTVMASPRQELTLTGDDGYIVIPNSNVGNEAYLYKNGELVEHFKQPYGNGFTFEPADFIRCVNEGKLENEPVPASASNQCAEIFDLGNPQMEGPER